MMDIDPLFFSPWSSPAPSEGHPTHSMELLPSPTEATGMTSFSPATSSSGTIDRVIVAAAKGSFSTGEWSTSLYHMNESIIDVITKKLDFIITVMDGNRQLRWNATTLRANGTVDAEATYLGDDVWQYTVIVGFTSSNDGTLLLSCSSPSTITVSAVHRIVASAPTIESVVWSPPLVHLGARTPSLLLVNLDRDVPSPPAQTQMRLHVTDNDDPLYEQWFICRRAMDSRYSCSVSLHDAIRCNHSLSAVIITELSSTVGEVTQQLPVHIPLICSSARMYRISGMWPSYGTDNQLIDQIHVALDIYVASSTRSYRAIVSMASGPIAPRMTSMVDTTIGKTGNISVIVTFNAQQLFATYPSFQCLQFSKLAILQVDLFEIDSSGVSTLVDTHNATNAEDIQSLSITPCQLSHSPPVVAQTREYLTDLSAGGTFSELVINVDLYLYPHPIILPHRFTCNLYTTEMTPIDVQPNIFAVTNWVYLNVSMPSHYLLTVPCRFDGNTIRRLAINGPYNLQVVGENGTISDVISTKSYMFTSLGSVRAPLQQQLTSQPSTILWMNDDTLVVTGGCTYSFNGDCMLGVLYSVSADRMLNSSMFPTAAVSSTTTVIAAHHNHSLTFTSQFQHRMNESASPSALVRCNCTDVPCDCTILSSPGPLQFIPSAIAIVAEMHITCVLATYRWAINDIVSQVFGATLTPIKAMTKPIHGACFQIPYLVQSPRWHPMVKHC
jgi:hypothetical protein